LLIAVSSSVRVVRPCPTPASEIASGPGVPDARGHFACSKSTARKRDKTVYLLGWIALDAAFVAGVLLDR
jgi:hypothetical protein